MSDTVMVSTILRSATRPAVRQFVYCISRECGWKGQILQSLILKKKSRQYGNLYIVCPRCGGGLIDLSTNQPRRWV